MWEDCEGDYIHRRELCKAPQTHTEGEINVKSCDLVVITDPWFMSGSGLVTRQLGLWVSDRISRLSKVVCDHLYAISSPQFSISCQFESWCWFVANMSLMISYLMELLSVHWFISDFTRKILTNIHTIIVFRCCSISRSRCWNLDYSPSMWSRWYSVT